MEVLVNVIRGIARDRKNIYRLWIREDPNDSLKNIDRLCIEDIKTRQQKDYYYIDSLYLIEFDSIASSLPLNIILASLTITLVKSFFLGETGLVQNILIPFNFFMLILILALVLIGNAHISPEDYRPKINFLISAIVCSIFTIALTIFFSIPFI